MSRYNYAALLVLVNSILFGIITTYQNPEISTINIFGNGATNFLIMISIIAPSPHEFKYALDTTDNKKNIYIILSSLASIFVSYLFRSPEYNTVETNLVRICFSIFAPIAILFMLYIIYFNRYKIVLLSLVLTIICYILLLITLYSHNFAMLLSVFLTNIGGAFSIPYTLFFILIIFYRFINKYFE